MDLDTLSYPDQDSNGKSRDSTEDRYEEELYEEWEMLYYGSEDALYITKNSKLPTPNPPPQIFSGLPDEWWSNNYNSNRNSHNRYLYRTNSISSTTEGEKSGPTPDPEIRETPSKDPPPAQTPAGTNPTLQCGRG